jgi:hypothetical protein
MIAPNAPDSKTLSPSKTSEITETPTILVAPTREDDMPKDPPLFSINPDLQALTERAKADLAQRLSIPASQIKAIETKEVVWPDASFGCPQPGIVYAQISTAGYRIKLLYSGNEFEYHVDIRDNIFYCENPTPPMVGTPAGLDPFRIAPP